MQFDEKQIDWLADLLADAANEEIMPRFRQLGQGDIRQKTSAADLVTEADVNAERYITARLNERFPNALIVGKRLVLMMRLCLMGSVMRILHSRSIQSMAPSILLQVFPFSA